MKNFGGTAPGIPHCACKVQIFAGPQSFRRSGASDFVVPVRIVDTQRGLVPRLRSTGVVAATFCAGCRTDTGAHKKQEAIVDTGSENHTADIKETPDLIYLQLRMLWV
jgi:hypothetical protein